MTKTNPRLTRYFIPLLLSVMLAFIFKACKKNDFSKEEITEPVSKFFTVPSNTPSPVLKVVDALKKQNDIGGFIPSLAKNDGYAVWNKSMIELSPSFAVVRVPTNQCKRNVMKKRIPRISDTQFIGKQKSLVNHYKAFTVPRT